MERPKICLTLTGQTLQDNLDIINKYRKYIDIAELRVDFLTEDERLLARKFPSMAGLPCILTIRRQVDGGKFIEGEANRTTLFARALAFVDEDKSKNFSYVDFEEDFHVSSLQDAALAYGLKIIRSVHDMEHPVTDIKSRLEKLTTNEYEIPKIAFMPHTLEDVRLLFEQAARLKDRNHILLAMGPLGTPSRILSAKLNNYLTYTSAIETNDNISHLGQLDPVTLHDVYHFKDLKEETRIFGITGWPLNATSSPVLHNKGYEDNNIDAVYIPVRAEKFSHALHFAATVGITGLSVTIPHKEAVLEEVRHIDGIAHAIGACNTIVKSEGEWYGFNTDVTGFSKALLEFTGTKNLAHKKVAVIGAGGAARAIVYAIKKLHGKACIFNRTIRKAQTLAETYGFTFASLSQSSLPLLKKYNDIIIQTTSKGMGSSAPSSEENDPLYFYNFTGKELLFDIVYVPSVTPIMERAASAGCKVCNGYSMLRYQGYEQFELFTGTSMDLP